MKSLTSKLVLAWTVFPAVLAFGTRHLEGQEIPLPALKDVYRTDRQLSMFPNTFSLAVCLARCAADSRCMSYFFNALTKVCRLNAVVYIDASQSITADTGSRYYIAFQKELCPPVYMHDREAKLCYALFGVQNVDFPVLDSMCASQGGELMKIDSAEKQSRIQLFIGLLPHPYTCIQGNEDGHIGTWTYLDSTVLTYFHWDTANGQPEVGAGEHYLIVRNDRNLFWYDIKKSYGSLQTNVMCGIEIV